MTPEELDVAAAPLAFPETDHDDNDTNTNQDDPRNEKRPVLGKRTASSAAPTNAMAASMKGFHQRQVVGRVMGRLRQCSGMLHEPAEASAL